MTAGSNAVFVIKQSIINIIFGAGWLNKLWDYSIDFDLDQFDYYDNTIKMVTMIILSGNYLSPQRDA
jgi:hypothetical protein